MGMGFLTVLFVEAVDLGLKGVLFMLDLFMGEFDLVGVADARDTSDTLDMTLTLSESNASNSVISSKMVLSSIDTTVMVSICILL
jgi:uncharacterized protein with GYD domain